MMCVVYVFILNVAIKEFCMEFGEREREVGGGERLHVKLYLLFCCFFSPQVVVIDTSKYLKKKKHFLPNAGKKHRESFLSPRRSVKLTLVCHISEVRFLMLVLS